MGRQQQQWAKLAALLGGNITQAYLVTAPSGGAGVAAGANMPQLVVQTRERKALETARAKIGLAFTDLVLDVNGAYRAELTCHIDNSTEQYLEIELPEGATLWTARWRSSAQDPGTPVKPTLVPGQSARRVRIPLVKTAPGELDYEVVLKYGGRMPPVGPLAEVSFPLVHVLRIPVELSQVRLYLPETHDWFHFGGTMGRVEEAEQAASQVSYQTKVIGRLKEDMTSYNPFTQARAANNLKQLGVISDRYDSVSGRLPGAAHDNVKLQEELVQGKRAQGSREGRRSDPAGAPARGGGAGQPLPVEPAIQPTAGPGQRQRGEEARAVTGMCPAARARRPNPWRRPSTTPNGSISRRISAGRRRRVRQDPEARQRCAGRFQGPGCQERQAASSRPHRPRNPRPNSPAQLLPPPENKPMGGQQANQPYPTANLAIPVQPPSSQAGLRYQAANPSQPAFQPPQRADTQQAKANRYQQEQLQKQALPQSYSMNDDASYRQGGGGGDRRAPSAQPAPAHGQAQSGNFVSDLEIPFQAGATPRSGSAPPTDGPSAYGAAVEHAVRMLPAASRRAAVRRVGEPRRGDPAAGHGYFFSTLRGEAEITAQAASGRLLAGLGQAAAIALAAPAVWYVFASARRGRFAWLASRRTATVFLVAGVLAFCFLPGVAILAIAAGSGILVHNLLPSSTPAGN